MPLLILADLTIVRMLPATLPFLPITLPISSLSTRTVTTVTFSLSSTEDIETASSHPSEYGMQQIKTQVLEVFDRV